MASTRKKAGRKLLVATLGVAAVSYLGACASRERTGNLVAPPPREEAVPGDAGLEEPIPGDASVDDAGTDAASDTTSTGHTGHPGDIVANLMPPPEPTDGGDKK